MTLMKENAKGSKSWTLNNWLLNCFYCIRTKFEKQQSTDRYMEIQTQKA